MLQVEFTRAFRCSTPLVAVETPDPAAAISAIVSAVESLATNPTGVFCVAWDIAGGLRCVVSNPTVAKACEAKMRSAMFTDGIDATRGNPLAMLDAANKVPANGVIFFQLADAFLHDPAVMQGVWNLRDLYASTGRCLVLLGSTFRLPASLKHDVHLLDDPLPGPEAIAAIIKQTTKDAKVKVTPEEVSDAAAALQGLSAFSAGQVLAISCLDNKLDKPHLWERKRRAIEQTPGLSVWRGGESFDGIGGVANVKSFLSRVIAGPKKPEAVVFIDEIEKALAGSGSGGDSSGVSQGLLQQLLTYMQDQAATGCIFIGPPGTCKSMVAKAAGHEAGCDTICLDMGGMKGSLVGESEQRMREALKVISAHSNGKSLWIATCNSIGALPPELRRRFTFGTFFFDLPDADERRAIWDIYAAKYKTKGPRPEDEGWTGAEIRQCCDVAAALASPLTEAAQYVVPVSVSARDQIEALRTQASGRFLSASHPGTYVKPSDDVAPTNGRGQRVIR